MATIPLWDGGEFIIVDERGLQLGEAVGDAAVDYGGGGVDGERYDDTFLLEVCSAWSAWGFVVAMGLVLSDLNGVDIDGLVVGSDWMEVQAISLPLMRAR